MTFLGDEGRDVIIVRRLLIEHHPPLIGPGTSIGNMYLGPAYYYMMAIPLLIANFNPVGPAIFIAIVGVISIYFVWYITRQWFPSNKINSGALVAAFLYAISPVIIIYSRSSWNPNIMPFFSLATVYFMWRVWARSENSQAYKWLIVVGISFACVLQSHYLGLLLLPVIGILWIFALLLSIKKQVSKSFIIYSIISFIAFLILMSPLAIFDFRHNFINSNAMKAFFTNREQTVSVLPWKAVPLIWTNFTNITSDLVGAKNLNLGLLIAGIISIAFIYVGFFKKEKYNFKSVSVIIALCLWLGFALIGLGLYKQHIYDHYYGFIFTAPYIILGGIIEYVLSNKKLRSIAIVLIFIFVLVLTIENLSLSPLRQSPNKQLERARIVSKKIEEISNGQRFNFALIADSNYESAYRYFLDIDHAKVIDIDRENTKDTVTPQLMLVCAKLQEKCDPTHNPKRSEEHTSELQSPDHLVCRLLL